ncbi:hypothetical protein [Flammeovirga kamogawensis]|uniref:Uncharacterized protein n=1 Tax=Flammeovirga kamogawensis TaxID=373891 RepID=A0ABX8H3D8_9BACT|nr:hypothetical protein [Flammeovirga kamogawensis]MBB6461976.1 hypothetical protein [Flammeovirga kamogawensis]QWG10420.1 hypothetical protein KM029_25935 [Flammeovirga kamogawensis]TRX63930.1 hypothetical protein EO216_26310 [Flammeovirga kamogawensis]
MKDIKVKILEIFLPYLLVNILSFVIYSIIYWIIVYVLDFADFSYSFSNIIVLFTIPFSLVNIFLKKRIKRLDVKTERMSGSFLYHVILVVSIFITLVGFGSEVLRNLFFNLVEVENLDEIKLHSDQKYFSIDNFDLDLNLEQEYIHTIPPSRSSSMELVLYKIFKFKNSENIWYGLSFNKTLYGPINEKEITLNKRVFSSHIQRSLESYNFKNVDYFEKELNPHAKNNFQFNGGNQIILLPRRGEFETRLDNTFIEFFRIYLITVFIILILIIIPKLKKENQANIS